jgi:hypothetical protein
MPCVSVGEPMACKSPSRPCHRPITQTENPMSTAIPIARQIRAIFDTTSFVPSRSLLSLRPKPWPARGPCRAAVLYLCRERRLGSCWSSWTPSWANAPRHEAFIRNGRPAESLTQEVPTQPSTARGCCGLRCRVARFLGERHAHRTNQRPRARILRRRSPA